MRRFMVSFLDRETQKSRRVTVEASDWGKPIADAVAALGGDPETIGSVWEV